MATEKQIVANRRNSELSTGPSESGKSRSRLGATRHGLASRSVEVEATLSPEFAERRASWGLEQQPVGEAAGWALDRAVAATFRIERCEQAINDHITDFQARAELTWEEDRAFEAATVFGKLGKDPIIASRQLQTTLAGVVLLLEAWMLLHGTLEQGEDWSEAERTRALDLYGIASDLRNGRMPLDAPDDTDRVAYRKSWVLNELERLEALRDQAMIPLDEMMRRRAMKGDLALLSKEAKLLLRYEREAWKQYHQSMKEVKDSRAVVAPTPAPAPTPVVLPRHSPETPSRPTNPAVIPPRPPVQAEATPRRNEANPARSAMDFLGEDTLLDELERRMGIQDAEMPFTPERSQFANFAVGRAS